MISLPKRPRGRPNAKVNARYEIDVKAFCAHLLKLRSRLDFDVSARGWCYILEEKENGGLSKGDFDCAEKLINDCRKSGHLPLNICGEDTTRVADHLDGAAAWENEDGIEDAVEAALQDIEHARELAIAQAGYDYTPYAFWFGQDYYLESLVEKIDLKSLFKKVCRPFYIPIGNSKGWADISSRANMMSRFAYMERLGKKCVLLYCGDHDPAGLHISDFLRSNMEDLAGAVGWTPDNLIIDRFGLNIDFIKQNNLSWIDGLQTGSGKNLDDPKHPDHFKPYVQDYLKQYGARKVEANALVVRPEAGRQLCLDAITKYVDADAPARYRQACRDAQRQIAKMVRNRLGMRP